MLLPLKRLLLTVSGQASNGTTHRATDPVRNTASVIVQLSLRFLTLAGGILLRALTLESFSAYEPAERLLAAADGLVPGTFLTSRVVLRDCARGGD